MSSCISTSIRRFTVEGVQTTVVDRPGCRELMIAANALPGECPCRLFERAARALAEYGGQVVTQQVFGFSQPRCKTHPAFQRFLAGVNWPVTWIDDAHPDRPHLAGTLIHAIAGLNLHRLRLNDRVVATTYEDSYARYCAMGDLRDLQITRPAADQTQQVFDDMETVLRQNNMTFLNVIRTWFWNRDILAWYGDFNKVRTAFFNQHKVFEHMVPASTGIGSPNPHGSALVAAALAIDAKAAGVGAQAVPSPLQCPALDYGSSFARAVELRTPDYRWLTISGTASIYPDGRTAFLDDMPAQVDLTMRVVEGILQSRRMNWDDVIRGVAYIRNAHDSPAYYDFCRKKGIVEMPVVVTRNVVCRDDLLFEIEADALSADAGPV